MRLNQFDYDKSLVLAPITKPPPEASKLHPDINEASEEISHRIGKAISCASAVRFIAIVEFIFFLIENLSRTSLVISVRVTPGLTQLTRIP